jgi:hypothetical protein
VASGHERSAEASYGHCRRCTGRSRQAPQEGLQEVQRPYPVLLGHAREPADRERVPETLPVRLGLLPGAPPLASASPRVRGKVGTSGGGDAREARGDRRAGDEARHRTAVFLGRALLRPQGDLSRWVPLCIPLRMDRSGRREHRLQGRVPNRRRREAEEAGGRVSCELHAGCLERAGGLP